MNRMIGKRAIGCALAILTLAAGANADEIQIGNRIYQNVLVDKGTTMYYIRIPDEGRILIVPEGEVDSNTVKRNTDPFYREELRDRFEEARAAGGAATPGGRVFAGGIVEGEAQDVDINSLLGGGGGGGGLTLGGPLPIAGPAQIQQMTGGFGIQFQPAGNIGGRPARRANLPGGAGTMVLIGPDNQTFGVVIEAQAPEQALTQSLGQLGLLLGPLNGPTQQAIAEAKQNGSSTKTGQGGKVTVRWQGSPDNATVNIQIVGA
jgi:hypothetical protein